MERVIVSVFFVSNPGSTLRSLARLRTISPAPTIRTSASATSATTSALRVPPPPASESARPRPCLSASLRLALVRRHAGASPASMPVTSERTRVKARTPASTPTSLTRGSWSPRNATMSLTPKPARKRPSAPPATARSSVSANICCRTRRRLAPSAVRTAISLRRPRVFARTRLATLAQAIRRTKPTAPRSTSRAGRTSPTRSSRSGMTMAPQPLLSSGYCWARRAESVFISACACSTARRASAAQVRNSRGCPGARALRESTPAASRASPNPGTRTGRAGRRRPCGSGR